MAEFAQRRIEEMTMEVEKMRKIGLFTTEEARALMKKRKRFEYKMQRRTKEKEVYFQYIQYEIAALRLIKLRREQRRIELGKDEIEKEIIMRVYQLFRIACFRFKSDVKIWLSHIDFATQNMDKQRVSKIFTSMLQVHNKKPHLWIMAAKFEFETNESIESARNLFQRALRFLPQSVKLWIEYFKMELLCVEVIMKRKELLGLTELEDDKTNKAEDAILSGKIAEIVFRNAVKEMKEHTAELVRSMIQVASEFKFTENLVEQMYKFLSEDPILSKSEQSWDILARRYLAKESQILKQCEQTGQVADFTIAEFEEKTNEAYLNALKTMSTQAMHLLYVEFCIERLKLNSKFLNEERFERANNAFRTYESQFEPSIDLLLEWLNFLIKFNNTSQAQELIDKYLVNYSKNKDLLSLNLRLQIEQTTSGDKDNEKRLFDVFYQMIKDLKEKDTLDMWKMMISWCLINKSGQTEKLIKEGSLKGDRSIAIYSRLKYLSWSLESQQGIKLVRQVYESLRQLPPFSEEFFMSYIEIEKCGDSVNFQRIVNAFEDATRHFGKESLNVWLSYIDFVHRNGSKKTGTTVGDIHWRAMKSLDTSLVEEFSQKFCLLKIDNAVEEKIQID